MTKQFISTNFICNFFDEIANENKVKTNTICEQNLCNKPRN
jgi:hypothetical protein